MTHLRTWIERHFMALELVAALAATVAFVYWAEARDGLAVVTDLLAGRRTTVYGSVATILGSLLGFVITAVSILVGFSQSPQLEVVRGSRHYRTLWITFTRTIWVLGLATVTALVALVLDHHTSPTPPALYAVFFFTLLSALYVAACVWILERVVGLVT